VQPTAGPERRDAGFSLIEIVVVLVIVSLMAGSGAAVALRVSRGNLKERTLLKLREIHAGMVGAPERGYFGYLGDMGELPDTALTQLFIKGSQPSGVADLVDGILSGYNGPYVLNGTHDTLGFVDAWNSQVLYTPGSAQLTSPGPDRSLGTSDDIVYPPNTPAISGTLTVTVRGLLVSGGLPLTLRSDEASVQVSYTRSSDNSRDVASVSYTGAQGSGLWVTDQALHRGYHGIQVTGLDASGSGGRDFSGSVARAVVSISGGPAFAEILLEEAP